MNPFIFLWHIFSGLILFLWPIVGFIILARITWVIWVHYVQQDWISGITWTMLEIVPPREVLRSPKAMELFISNAFYHWSMKGASEEYWQGSVWLWFSLEIASIEGQVHFYIRTPSRIQGLVETQMYAQYPQAQVKVVEDYTLAIDDVSEKGGWKLWGCEFKMTKPFAFPLKTYVDYGLDSDIIQEENKVDPISSVIELFGSIGKGEQMWSQIIITPQKRAFHTRGTWFKSHDWVKEAQVQIEDFLAPYTGVREKAGSPGEFSKDLRPPKHLDPAINAASLKMQKLGFDAGIRIAYVAKREIFNMSNRRNIRTIWRQYAAPHSNELSRINSTQADAYADPDVDGFLAAWFLVPSKIVNQLEERHLHAYREREFFHLPMRHHLFNKHRLGWPISPFIFPAYFHPELMVLNVEEIATMWHFPGQILKVPTLERIESKEAAPPTNLPT
ncbi:MAG: hypothetical protein V4439_03160 [Patescibacteria group bacterium]